MKVLQPQSVKTILFVFLLPLAISLSIAQPCKYHTKDDLSLVVSGTSTLHDWKMKTSKGEVNATFTLSTNGQVTAFNFLSFSTPAESIKSEHTAMDKNAYKALKTDKNPSINYTLTTATITTIDAATYSVKGVGKLTIAGITKDAELVATCKVNADKSISVSGTKKISMKDFNIDPPSFMMGTIKTGNDIVLKFDLTINK